ncbi:MAG TPA: DUF5703 domain-containing protein [Edaphobacter sp.]|nr:DUF5703 domain-containing protein [Edaphobacter sp.]
MNRREFNKTAAAAFAATATKDMWASSRVRDDAAPAFLRERLERYNPTWRSPSNSSLGSMPLSGSQGTGLNVWVQNGAVYFYITRNNAYDEDGNLDKLGCIRLQLQPNPIASAKAFEQKLDIYTSRLTIDAQAATGETCKFLIWLDLRKPIVFVETSTSIPTHLEVAFMTWREQVRHYPLDNWNIPFRKGAPANFGATADQIEAKPRTLTWFHRNNNHALVADKMVSLQKFTAAADTIVDPSRDLIFGGELRGSNLEFLKQEPISFQQWQGRAWIYHTPAASRSHITTVAILCEQNPSLDKWKQKLTRISQRFDTAAARQRSKESSEKEWHRFWAKSYIFINSNKGPDDIGWQVGKNYQLFRYMLACNRGGTLPLKFNGGIFNVDTYNPEPYRVIDGGPPPMAPPDRRRWGNLFMAQNQRLIGWPGLLSGDFDLMAPSLDFYAERAKTAVARSQIYWHHNGAAFVEPLSLYGLPVQRLATDHGPCSARHLAWHFSIQIEFAWMALERTTYSGEDVRPYLPLIEAIVRFYDEHYRKEHLARTGSEYDANGRLVLFPMNCLELYANATDPIEVVCGLHRVVEGVLALPASTVPPSMRDYFRQLQPRLPQVQFEVRDGKKVLKPAKEYDANAPLNKTEFPEGYAVWPYRMYGIGSRNGSSEANNTWETMPAQRKAALDFVSWQCTPIYAALMGRHDDAKRLTIDKLADQNASLRFKAFFGPGHDWIPDHNWGGSAMIGLQSMIVAPADKGIYLLPAWPKDWDADFRLHLPHQASITGNIQNGKMTRHNIATVDGKAYPHPVVQSPSASIT